MRISDWSSDVCSSDLPSGSYIRVRSGLPPAPIVRSLALGVVALTLVWIFGLFFIERQDVSEYFRWYVVHYWVEGVWEVIHIALVDRKSVVSGKSVSVRVDLGGRRSIKKKKTKI